MALYTGKDLGDLISVTLNKCVPPSFSVEKLVPRACLTLFSAVEATLAIILLLITFIFALLVMNNFGRGLKEQSTLFWACGMVSRLTSVYSRAKQAQEGRLNGDITICASRSNEYPSKPDEYRLICVLLCQRCCSRRTCVRMTSHSQVVSSSAWRTGRFPSVYWRRILLLCCSGALPSRTRSCYILTSLP